jgi:hypothetical protein
VIAELYFAGLVGFFLGLLAAALMQASNFKDDE